MSSSKAPKSTETQVRQSRIRPATDPRTRKDGRCRVCKQPRTRAVGILHDDPFCSSRCAREHYGTQLKELTTGKHVRVKPGQWQ